MANVNQLTKMPKITVIITYYNLKEYLKDCIKSILNQTYSNFEIVIVNDCSDEKNTKILSEIKNEKVKIINSKENLGQLGAFLLGLENSEGEFVCSVDADDILLPNYLKTLLYVHLNNNTALVSCACGEINSKNEIISLNYVANPIKIKQEKINYTEIEKAFKNSDDFKLEFLTTKELPFAMWGWNPMSSGMFRRTSLDILKYYPDIKYWKTGADKVIFSFLHLIGGSVNISAICFLYRHHNSNSSQTTLTCGNKKYINEKYVEKLIAWNKKIRLDAIKMFIKNRKELIKEYNKINYYKMLKNIVFCVNFKICAKALKAFAHKII